GAVLDSFFAFDQNFTAGIFVAAGDVNGDGRADIACGPGLGRGPDLRIIDGATTAPLNDLAAYTLGNQVSLSVNDNVWTSGLRVGLADFNNDGLTDAIVGPGRGRPALIRILSPLSGAEIDSFFAYDPSYTGGVFIAGGH